MTSSSHGSAVPESRGVRTAPSARGSEISSASQPSSPSSSSARSPSSGGVLGVRRWFRVSGAGSRTPRRSLRMFVGEILLESVVDGCSGVLPEGARRRSSDLLGAPVREPVRPAATRDASNMTTARRTPHKSVQNGVDLCPVGGEAVDRLSLNLSDSARAADSPSLSGQRRPSTQPAPPMGLRHPPPTQIILK